MPDTPSGLSARVWGIVVLHVPQEMIPMLIVLHKLDERGLATACIGNNVPQEMSRLSRYAVWLVLARVGNSPARRIVTTRARSCHRVHGE